jgi:peroxiredoxin
MKNTIQTLLRLAFVAALAFSLNVSAEDNKPTYKDAVKELLAKVRPMMAKDSDEAATAYLKGARELTKQFPNEIGARAMMLAAASISSDEKLKKKIITELAGLKEKKFARITDRAKAELKKMNALGNPVAIKFTAVDGRKVDLSKMKGKVVLIDFWATWRGPCVEEIPNLKKTYAKLHKKGFEIVGISLDSKEDKLTKFVADKGMTWPQHFDSKGRSNTIAKEFGIRSIPAMWLIDTNGNLVDMNARHNLEEKVEKLLAAGKDGANEK